LVASQVRRRRSTQVCPPSPRITWSLSKRRF
jgi:hypothetical protein